MSSERFVVVLALAGGLVATLQAVEVGGGGGDQLNSAAIPPPGPPLLLVGTSAQCEVSTNDRKDCGFYGINQGSCEAKGCCWAPVGAEQPGVPWCFFKSSPAPTPVWHWTKGNPKCMFDDPSGKSCVQAADGSEMAKYLTENYMAFDPLLSAFGDSLSAFCDTALYPFLSAFSGTALHPFLSAFGDTNLRHNQTTNVTSRF